MHVTRRGGRGVTRLLVALILTALLLPISVGQTAAAVEVRSTVAPASVAKGDTTSIKVEIKNNSSQGGYGYVYTYVRSPSGSTVAYSRAMRFLPSGRWVGLYTSYRVPTTAVNGTYRVDVQVTGAVSYSGTGLATFTVGGGTQAPTPTATPPPTPTPTSTPAPTPTSTPTPTSPPSSGATQLDQMEAEFLTLINNYRAQHGVAPLARNSKLDAAAYDHSEDMATRGYFSHYTPEGKSPWTRMAEAGYTCNSYKGENIAAGYASAQAVFNAWKSSSGHNRNMLSSNFDEIGIGLAYSESSPYRYYWTTDFGRCV